MQSNQLAKLQTSLADAIQEWINEQSGESEWDALYCYIGDHTSELMAASAFNVLLAQKDLTEYLTKEGHLD